MHIKRLLVLALSIFISSTCAMQEEFTYESYSDKPICVLDGQCIKGAKYFKVHGSYCPCGPSWEMNGKHISLRAYIGWNDGKNIPCSDHQGATVMFYNDEFKVIATQSFSNMFGSSSFPAIEDYKEAAFRQLDPVSRYTIKRAKVKHTGFRKNVGGKYIGTYDLFLYDKYNHTIYVWRDFKRSCEEHFNEIKRSFPQIDFSAIVFNKIKKIQPKITMRPSDENHAMDFDDYYIDDGEAENSAEFSNSNLAKNFFSIVFKTPSRTYSMLGVITLAALYTAWIKYTKEKCDI